MYLAHPDLTNREEFTTILQPLLNQHTREGIDIQAVSEFVHITLSNSIRQRVVVLQSDFDKLDVVCSFCMETFAEESSLPIGPLARYTFVLRHPIGECTLSYLHTLF